MPEPFYAVSVFVGLLQLIRERTVVGNQVQPLDTWYVSRADGQSEDVLPVSLPLQSDRMEPSSPAVH
jgi:hypothetical protein